MRKRNNLHYNIIRLKNSIDRKSKYLILPAHKVNTDVLNIFISIGLVSGYYNLPKGRILITFLYHYGKPFWNIKTSLSKANIGTKKKL